MLRCSEWWIKEQARCRRIPFSWIGGSYLFTEAHVAEIVRLFEVRPVEAGASASPTGRVRRSGIDAGPRTTVLVARVPRRARAARRGEAA
jgi:hypothetical protein